jgi:mannitol-specific phosphotransferase system IIBC component
MESNNSLHAGTASGTLLSIMPTIASEDVLKTIVLAIVGAVVSFGVSVVLRRITKSKGK